MDIDGELTSWGALALAIIFLAFVIPVVCVGWPSLFTPDPSATLTPEEFAIKEYCDDLRPYEQAKEEQCVALWPAKWHCDTNIIRLKEFRDSRCYYYDYLEEE